MYAERKPAKPKPKPKSGGFNAGYAEAMAKIKAEKQASLPPEDRWVTIEDVLAMEAAEEATKPTAMPMDPEKLAAELAELEEEAAQAREPKPLPPLVWKTPVILEVPLDPVPPVEGNPEMARRYAEHSARMDDLVRFLPAGAA